MSVVSDFGEGHPTPLTTIPDSPVKAADPETLEGQRVGAILRVKWISNSINCHPAVGDYVKILDFDLHGWVDVENMRTGGKSSIKWEVMFPVPYYRKCLCSLGTCVCVYGSYDDFVVRLDLNGPLSLENC